MHRPHRFLAEWAWDHSKSMLVAEAEQGRIRLLAPRHSWFLDSTFFGPVLGGGAAAVSAFGFGELTDGWSIGAQLVGLSAFALAIALIATVGMVSLAPYAIARRPVAALDIRLHRVRARALSQEWKISWGDNYAWIHVWGLKRSLVRATESAGGLPNAT